ncbi:MAG: carboxy terminal-processing peptidase [Limisphaerales bacterium]
MNRFLARILLFLLSCNLVCPLFSAEPSRLPCSLTTAQATQPASLPAPSSVKPDAVPAGAQADAPENSTNVFHALKPGPDDGKIAYTTAWMLEHSQFLRRRFNVAVSIKFFDRYLETYDPQHSHFLQTDIAGFEHYRTNLNKLTLSLARADTSPACEIFNRFMERLQQQVAYVDDLLDHEKFTFDTDERVVINRKELPYPKNLDEAKKLWRERLRAEYLQEKLVDSGAKKKASRGSPKETTSSEAAPNVAAKPKTEHETIVEILHRRYHRTLRAFEEFDDEYVLGIYLTTLAHVYDPHSDYMTHSQLESFSIAMNLRLEGIGAELRSEDGYCTIFRLLAGGPALKCKQIKENDRIVAVAQSNSPPVDLVDMRLDKAVQLIRGPKGTQITLTIQPAGADASARRCITLIRDEIRLEDQEAKAKVIEVPDGHGANLRLGVIDLPSFYAPMDLTGSRTHSDKSTSADVSRFLNKLKKENVAGVILDLRLNGGGSLDEAIKLTGLFIKEGPVVQVRNWDGSIEKDMDPDPGITYDGPLIVLTSRLSASASEILAGALQDYSRALIVGDSSTHGKGTVQSLVPVMVYYTNIVHGANLAADPGAMKITIKKFYRPSGASTQRNGVVPDIILPSILGESKEIGEKTLENALEPDAIPSTEYEHLNLVGPYLPELRKHSAQRLAADPEYTYIRQDIELYKKLEADKSISLNENQRLKQKEEDDAREKSRENERLARKPSPEIVHELTLKQVDQPGLPPPLEKTNSVAKLLGRKDLNSSPGVTNASVATQPRARLLDDDLQDALDEEKPPAVDAALEETEHILVDYLSVLPKTGFLTSGRTTAATTR